MEKDWGKKRIIAVFDFDGTITNSDSFLSILWHETGVLKKISAAWLFIPYIRYLLKTKRGDNVKELIFSHFFKGMTYNHYLAVTDRYAKKYLKKIIRSTALTEIENHKKQGYELVVASASMRDWIEPWAKEYGIKVIATEAEVVQGVLTGKFKTKNCRGSEKLRRFLEEYPERSSYYLIAYGDSKDDRPLLDNADSPFYRRL